VFYRLVITSRILLGIVLSAGSVAAQHPAQPADSQGDFRQPLWEVGPYVGVSLHSPVGTHLGVTPDRDHLFLGVHITANFLRRRRWSFAYAPEIVPLLLVTNNIEFRRPGTVTRRDPGLYEQRPVAGFAVSPIGLETQIRVTPRWRVYGAGAAGAVWFTRDVPVPGARAFNYTFEFGGGVQWRYRARDSLRVGYKFHHLSNAFTAPLNPGIDAEVFLVGFDRALGSR
jgi:hypothetical protein